MPREKALESLNNLINKITSSGFMDIETLKNDIAPIITFVDDPGNYCKWNMCTKKLPTEDGFYVALGIVNNKIWTISAEFRDGRWCSESHDCHFIAWSNVL